MCDGVEVAQHQRCWDRRRHIQDPQHTQKLLDQRKAARGPTQRERLAQICPESVSYFQEVARRRTRLDVEVEKVMRLVDRYGEAEVAAAISKAVAQRNFAARYVRALCDQARFESGQGEPPEPVVTGNPAADSLVVKPHDMETYDALFDRDPDAPAF